jgi:hypothetical protein
LQNCDVLPQASYYIHTIIEVMMISHRHHDSSSYMVSACQRTTSHHSTTKANKNKMVGGLPPAGAVN